MIIINNTKNFPHGFQHISLSNLLRLKKKIRNILY